MTAVNNEYIDITGLDEVEVFRRLYNASKPLGMGSLHFIPEDMSYKQAQQMFMPSSDYIQGRVMKVTFRTREVMLREAYQYGLDTSSVPTYEKFFSPRLYDRDNGPRAAEQVITKYRNEI